jgi:hypothetical protein
MIWEQVGPVGGLVNIHGWRLKLWDQNCHSWAQETFGNPEVNWGHQEPCIPKNMALDSPVKPSKGVAHEGGYHSTYGGQMVVTILHSPCGGKLPQLLRVGTQSHTTGTVGANGRLEASQP